MRAGFRFPTFSSSLGRPFHPHPSRNLAFFRRFPRGAQVATSQRPSSPMEGVGGGWWRRESQREREQSERRERAGCYICNVFAFTIFQLVCILEPLFYSPPLYSLDSSPLPFAMFESSSSLAWCLSLLSRCPRAAIVLSAPFFLTRSFPPKPPDRGSQRIPFSQIIPKTRRKDRKTSRQSRLYEFSAAVNAQSLIPLEEHPLLLCREKSLSEYRKKKSIESIAFVLVCCL